MKETFYELGYLLVPTLSDSEVTETKKNITDAITTVGATKKSEGDVHFIDLAYEMVKKVKSKNIKFDQAHFGWMKFTAEGDQQALLEKELKKNEGVLRTIVIKTVEDDSITDLFVSEEVIEEEVDVNEGVDTGEETKEEVPVAKDEDEKEEVTEEPKDSEEKSDEGEKEKEE